ncbi:MAG TPA: hypothetical protein ENK82_06790 [Campylobacterales bacterium]|nr:hypothetical protein [Campylobacterales bacterium]HHS93037.1 hypothetical protein [Campylobacterales bacterium]
MKVIIDLIEDLRESIQNNAAYQVTAMLLKANEEDEKKLAYAGEAPVASFFLDEEKRELVLSVDREKEPLKIGDFVPHLQIMGLDKMMYEVKLAVSPNHSHKEIVGFGVNTDESKYALFIMA